MANVLVYNMTHADQTVSVVLNRGAPTTIEGFALNDTVRFGDANLTNGSLAVDAHSVTVVELNVGDTGPTDNGTGNQTVRGCTDPLATNYDGTATEDDGSCQYPPAPVEGCTDNQANNFDPEATVDDGSCTYPPTPVEGCMDGQAINYDPEATVDDGSCQYPPPDDNTTEDNTTGNVTTNGTDNGQQGNNPSSNGTTNETENTNTTTEGEMQTCQGCCGETFEVSITDGCPVVDCLPCQETETSSSDAETVRAVMVLIVAVLVFGLVLTRRPPPDGDPVRSPDEDEF